MPRMSARTPALFAAAPAVAGRADAWGSGGVAAILGRGAAGAGAVDRAGRMVCWGAIARFCGQTAFCRYAANGVPRVAICGCLAWLVHGFSPYGLCCAALRPAGASLFEVAMPGAFAYGVPAQPRLFAACRLTGDSISQTGCACGDGAADVDVFQHEQYQQQQHHQKVAEHGAH